MLPSPFPSVALLSSLGASVNIHTLLPWRSRSALSSSSSCSALCRLTMSSLMAAAVDASAHELARTSRSCSRQAEQLLLARRHGPCQPCTMPACAISTRYGTAAIP